MDRRHERGQSTRRLLLAEARRLFAERGFSDVSTEDVVDSTGVTRGALYHHFGDKASLFAAVHEEIEEEIVAAAIAAAERESGPWASLAAGLNAYLDACTAPHAFQIALVDAPAVLGWSRWREVGARHGVRHVSRLLEEGVAEGALREHDVEIQAHLISRLVGEAALMLANAQDRAAARERVVAGVTALIGGLAAEPAV